MESIIRMFLTLNINNVLTREFVCLKKSTGTRGDSVRSARHETKALCQTTDSNRSHEPLLYSRILTQVSKDGGHIVEAVGSATSSISQCVFGRPSFEKLQTTKVFACHMSSVILTDIIKTVL